VRRGHTLVETLVAAAIATLVIGMAYAVLHHFFFAGSRGSLPVLSLRSSLQKDTKVGVRLLTYRLREAIQILSPPAGTAADELVFRDVTNADVRLRHIAAERRVISERLVGGAWVRETDPVALGAADRPVPASWPVRVGSCVGIEYTVLSGSAVAIRACLEAEGQLSSFVTVVKLRNTGRGY
jgi:hypothetical protein